MDILDSVKSISFKLGNVEQLIDVKYLKEAIKKTNDDNEEIKQRMDIKKDDLKVGNFVSIVPEYRTVSNIPVDILRGGIVGYISKIDDSDYPYKVMFPRGSWWFNDKAVKKYVFSETPTTEERNINQELFKSLRRKLQYAIDLLDGSGCNDDEISTSTSSF